jgi:multicomponent Na+:H+ antiporter subunit G
MPDFYTRMHAAGITDTLGADLILAGLMVQAGFSLVTVKLLLVAAFLFFTSPTSTHAIANAALTAGLKSRAAEDADTGNGSTAPEEDGP